ncbi:hypothetical protein COV93_05075 [Candidatus Woesearchaeota archaeon CG11_big_fil_rev_8_21_14_0_20_43_8]|nr:MAG: hypothetical protein COV93_05075 [Candidatus Woesearchaeota archaeon CG11_big_fil_rev_8_21_14_0_20_43_8]
MVDKEIVDYIKRYRKDSFTDSEIKESLSSQDIKAHLIKEAFDYIDNQIDDDEIKKGKDKATSSSDDSDVLSQKTKIISIVGCLVGMIISFILLKRSSLEAGFLLTPLTEFSVMLKGNSDINLMMVIASVVMFSVASVIIGYYAMKRDRDDFTIFSAPILLFILTLLFFGWSTLSAFAALGICGSIIYFILNIQKRKEHYKKTDFTEIIVGSYKHVFILMSIMIAIGVYITLAGSDDFAEVEINSLMASSGIDIDDGSDVQSSIERQQRDANHKMLESVEGALILAAKSDSSIEESCTDKIESKMKQIDTIAKQELDRQLAVHVTEDEDVEQNVEQISAIIEFMKKHYASMAAFSIFLVAEFIKGISGLLVLLCSYIISIISEGKIFGKERE